MKLTISFFLVFSFILTGYCKKEHRNRNTFNSKYSVKLLKEGINEFYKYINSSDSDDDKIKFFIQENNLISEHINAKTRFPMACKNMFKAYKSTSQCVQEIIYSSLIGDIESTLILLEKDKKNRHYYIQLLKRRLDTICNIYPLDISPSYKENFNMVFCLGLLYKLFPGKMVKIAEKKLKSSSQYVLPFKIVIMAVKQDKDGAFKIKSSNIISLLNMFKHLAGISTGNK